MRLCRRRETARENAWGRRLGLAAGLIGAAGIAASPASAAERVALAAVKRTPEVRTPEARTAEVAAAPSERPAGRDVVAVTVDHAKVIRLPERTQTVVVGNPMIADVTVQKNGILVVTGKSYGVTNLIALDGAGGLLAESLISVQGATEALVTVLRGKERDVERQTYACTPTCQPTLQLGDDSKYFSEVQGQAGQRNTLATAR
jgi:Flp pilus assembly secretin CpaC